MSKKMRVGRGPLKKIGAEKVHAKHTSKRDFFAGFKTRLVNNQWFMKHPSEKYARQNGNHLPQFSGGRFSKPN